MRPRDFVAVAGLLLAVAACTTPDGEARYEADCLAAGHSAGSVGMAACKARLQRDAEAWARIQSLSRTGGP